MFTAFQPAISKDAQNKISAEMRPLAAAPAHRAHLAEIARQINPVVRGWMQYYGAFYRSALYPLLSRINAYLMRWLRNKYKRLQPSRKPRHAGSASPPDILGCSPIGHGSTVQRVWWQDDKSPVTRLCRAPDYAELTSRSACPGWSTGWVV